MISDEDRARIDKLPTWARHIIHKLEHASEPLVEEAVRARQKATREADRANRLSNANAALMELLGKAGQAGLDWAATTVSVLEGYEIFRDRGGDS